MTTETQWRYDRLTWPEMRDVIRRDPQPVVCIPFGTVEAHSTPAEMLFTSTDFNSYVTVSIASGAPQRQGGRMAASNDAGLGIQPHLDILGKPVLDIH